MAIETHLRLALAAFSCTALAACSFGVDSAYVPPSMPTEAAAALGIRAAAKEANLTDPIEVSDFRETDHGPGRFFICIRGMEAKFHRLKIYAVFFNNDEYKGLRLPVILDDCEMQSYRRLS